MRPERGLIDPERAHPTQPGGVVDPGQAVVAHRGHGGVPADPELLGTAATK
jgi:hypothetical protein